MRIGLVIYGSLNIISGGYLYDRKLVEYLQAQGDTVEIIPMPWRGYANNLFDNWLPPLPNRLRTLEVDLLLQDELNHPSLFWLNQNLARQRRYPIVSIVHHLRSSESHPPTAMQLYRWVEKNYLHTVDGYIFNSKTTQKAVETLAGEDAAARPSLVAYPAADHLPAPTPAVLTNYIPLRCEKNGPLRILFVGNVIARKGLHMLLKALAALPKEQWKLDVVGNLTVDEEYVERIQQQIDKERLHEQVNLIGAVSDETLCNHYLQTNVLAVPSYEGFGIVYLEAMRFGVPVIGLMAGGAREIITPEENGFLIPPNDHASLAHYVQQLDADRGLLERMSMAAIRTYAAHPTWEQSCAAMHRWLHEFHTRHIVTYGLPRHANTD